MKSGIVVRSLLGLVRIMASISNQLQIMRAVGTAKLYLETAEAYMMSEMTLFRLKHPLAVIQSVSRDGFCKLCMLQEKQRAVGVTGFNNCDQSVTLQFSAEGGMLLNICPAQRAHFPVNCDLDVIYTPMADWLLRFSNLVPNCWINQRSTPVTNRVGFASRLSVKYGLSADMRRGVAQFSMNVENLRKLGADTWRLIVLWVNAERSIIAFVLPEQRSLTR